MSDEGLLPKSYDDFRSVKFWDGFFEKRGSRPFEWYGDWRQLKPLLHKVCLGKRVLVVGCGNSEVSAQLYDSGCQQITNIDFSKLLIKSMMQQNLRRRPKMKWQIMDMTDMKFKGESFDVVLDKGGLDALMGEDSVGGAEAGEKLLSEVARVLSPLGAYLCITLAQSHVFRLLLRFFRVGWQLRLAQIPPSPDMARSELQPLFVSVIKLDAGGAGPPSPVLSSLRPALTGPNTAQLAEVLQIVDEENARRASEPLQPAVSRVMGAISTLDKLHPGQRLELPLSQAQGTEGTPRFSAVVLDVAGRLADDAIQQCSVFIVPQGRDSEWLFSSGDGQWQLAGQCSSRRVILVTLGGGHTFGNTAAVQAELSPLVEPLAPEDLRGIPQAIPIMTTSEGVGQRTLLEQAESHVSGHIIVEDVVIAEGRRRRMVFTSNSNLIQSEAVVHAGNSPVVPVMALSACKKKGVKSPSTVIEKREAVMEPEVDYSCLAMDYHNAIIAGLSTLDGSNAELQPDSGCQRKAMVIGLGGGALAMFLHRYLGYEVDTVELDEVVVALAMRHFGFTNSRNLQARVGDGLVAIAEAARASPGSLDLLVVDAGSGDTSQAMSCPPAGFLHATFLCQARELLKPGGLLIINCVTRAQSAFQSAVQAVKAVSSCVYEVDVEEDLNRVLIAVKGFEGTDLSIARTEPKAHLRKLLQGVSAGTINDICSHLSSLKLVSST